MVRPAPFAAIAACVSGLALAQPAAEPPAATDGTRSVGRAEVARLERANAAPPSTTIWQSRLPDGTIELSDRPPPPGAKTIGQRSYALPDDAGARRRAQAERDYWRRQAEAFERRHERRERAEERERELAARRADRAPQFASYPVYLPVPPLARRGLLGPVEPAFGAFDPRTGIGVPAFGTVAPPGGLPSAYGSSPGAAQGRSLGFIGSGFSTGSFAPGR